jgi:hypothetical protein
MFVEPTMILFDVTHFFLNGIKVSYLALQLQSLVSWCWVFDFHEN